MTLKTIPVCALAWALAVGAVAPAAAQTLPPPSNVVSLGASASTEVTRDMMTVVLSTTREGADPGQVQSQLTQALEAALVEARKVARPVQLELQTGAFSLSPRYSQPADKTKQPLISGWIGTAELIVQGRDMAGIAQLSGRIRSLTVANVGYGLSRAAREKAEAEVTAEAITRFRARADAVSKQFGFASYVLRDVNVSSDGGGGPQPMYRNAPRMAASMAADESLPVESGKSTVTANVNGSVEMK